MAKTLIHRLAPIMGIISVLLWGSSFVVGKIAYEQLNPYELILLRMGFSAVLFLPYLIYRIYTVGLPHIRHMGVLTLIAFLGYPLTLGFQFYGLSYTEASVSSVAVGLEGSFTMVLAYLIWKQKPTRSNIFVAVMALIGLLLVVGIPSATRLTGVSLIMLANICAGLYLIISKPLLRTMNPIDLTGWTLVIGAVLIIIPAPLLADMDTIMSINAKTFWAIIALSVGATVLAYILHSVCLKYLSTTRTAQFIVIEPLIGVLAGVSILGEPLTWNIAFGTVVVISAMLVNSFIDDAKS